MEPKSILCFLSCMYFFLFLRVNYFCIVSICLIFYVPVLSTLSDGLQYSFFTCSNISDYFSIIFFLQQILPEHILILLLQVRLLIFYSYSAVIWKIPLTWLKWKFLSLELLELYFFHVFLFISYLRIFKKVSLCMTIKWKFFFKFIYRFIDNNGTILSCCALEIIS